MNMKIKFLLIVFLCGVYSEDKQLPSYLQPCSRNNKNMQGCIKKNAAILQPKLKDGVEELFIPPLRCFKLPKVMLKSGQDLTVVFNDIELYGVDNFVLKKCKVDLNKVYFGLQLEFPYLYALANYEATGQILALKLNGKGRSQGNFTNVAARIRINGEYVTKNDKKFIKMVNHTIDLKIGRPFLNFEGIFGDDVKLNEQTNKIVNENSKDLIPTVMPVIRDTISGSLLPIIRKILDTFPFDTMFPDK